ncbi:molybdate ABC transporter substrate-binding protein (plasmid) [Rhizobium lusitanum]|uniref:molybdate ABC transporter substrate-binding protein n=1 Tax=Rhizobium lusitanum TaxID=293958 RepID=UPI00160B99D2|nr:molybdate ABC transporter substrate-binding protein [Rhizobium lusitanum]QND45748.1 molybdate ABC transporter substrate-binding protein [Rhizobium lusitanum]
MTVFTQPLSVLSAGSMRHAFPALIAAFGKLNHVPVSLTLGPAGLLRERIEAGEHFDLFASANMAHPRRLAAQGITNDAVCFARNRLCVLARSDLGLTTANLLDVITDPKIKIGTSTPGDDPAGDYAFEVFDLIEAKRPGLAEPLKSRARQLVGGRNSPPAPSGKNAAWLVADGEVDLFLSYYSNARLLKHDSALSVVALPEELSPIIEYGVTARKGARAEAGQLREFLLSSDGQRILEQNGFEPI